jgi:hypothetical protein
MPRRKACASLSARWSSGKRASGVRAETRASPSRTSVVFTHVPSSVIT